MIGELNILAVGDFGDMITLIFVIIVVALSILAKLGEKWMRRQAEQKAEEARRQREARGEPARTDEPLTGPRPQPPRRRAQPLPMQRRASELPQPPPGQRRQPTPPPHRTPYQPAPQPTPEPVEFEPVEFEPVELEPVELEPVEPTPARRPARRAQKPRRISTAEDEIAQLQSRLRKLEGLHQKRLAARKPTEADTTRAMRERLGPLVDLSNFDRARVAIVFHEIFSPPKALREGGEVWDR